MWRISAVAGVATLTSWQLGKNSHSQSCWTDGYSHGLCCDIGKYGPGGNADCWDEVFTYHVCCNGTSAESEATSELRNHWEVPPLGTVDEISFGLFPTYQPGKDCWTGRNASYAKCCNLKMTPSADCWDHRFTSDRCCFLGEALGHPSPRPRHAEVNSTLRAVQISDPMVKCLELARLLTFDLEKKPRQCPQRYFFLATVGAGKGKDLRFVGGLCVPSSCTAEVTAKYLAPRVIPWWRSPRVVAQKLNASHVVPPMPLAVPYSEKSVFFWTARAPTEAFIERDRWDFAILEYKPEGQLSNGRKMLIFTACAAAFFHVTLPRDVEIENFLSPRFHLFRLGLPRGPKHLEIMRLLLTIMVLMIQVIDHGPWTPVKHHSGAAVLLLFRSCLGRVNIAFVVLLVHLSLSRRSLKQAISLQGWFKGMVFHGLKRLFVITPVLGFWNLVYVHMPFVDVPMNNIFKSQPLQLWYGERREQCKDSFHMAMSVLLIHVPVTGMASPCHHTAIFESLYQLDLLVFGLLSALGRLRTAQLSHLLWVLALFLSYSQVSPHEASFKDTSHSFTSLLPSALATLAISSWLPPHELPLAPRRGRMRLLTCCAMAGLLMTCLQDGLLHSEVVWPLQSWVEWLQIREHPKGRGYVIPCHLYELVLVWSLVVLLKQGWLNLNWQDGWSGMRALARMSLGVCVSNVFVLHFMGVFIYEDPVDLNTFSFGAHLLLVFAISLLVSSFVHILVEGPFACMIVDGLPQDVPNLPSAAAAA